MKRWISLTVIAVMLCSNAFAADIIIPLKIVSENVGLASQGFLAIYPNSETIDNPEWVDPGDGSVADKIAKYDTTKKWVIEKMRRILVRDIHRGLDKLAKAAAGVELDDAMVEAVAS